MNTKLILCVALIVTLTSCGGAEERKSVYMEKAKSFMKTENFDKARIELKNVLQIDPKNAEAYFQLGLLLEKKNNLTKAYQNYLKAEELDPYNLNNKARIGRILLLSSSDDAKAQEKIDFILEKEPEHVEGLLLKAATLLRNKNKDEAVAICEKILNRDPGNEVTTMFLSALYVNDKDMKSAIKVLRSSLRENKDNLALKGFLASTLISEKMYGEAENIYKNLLDNEPDNLSVYYRLSSLYHLMSRVDDAEKTLRKAIVNDPSDEDRYLTLINYLELNKSEKIAIKELEEILASNDELGNLRLKLAGLLLKVNETDSSIAENAYKNIITDFSNSQTGLLAKTALITIYIEDNKFEEASNLVEEAILASPNDPAINLLKAQIAINNNDYDEATISLRIVIKEIPEDIRGYMLLVEVYERLNNNEQVTRTLNEAYDANKNNPVLLLKLARYHFDRKNFEISENIVDNYNNLVKNDYSGLSIKASVLNENKSYSEAFKVAQNIIDLFPNKENGYIQSVPYYRQLKDKKAVIAVLEKGYFSVHDNKNLLISLTILQTEEKQYDLVEKRLNAEISNSPKNQEVKILLANVYAAQKKYNLAKSVLTPLILAQTKNESVYILMARVHGLQNNITEKENVLEQGMSNIKSSHKLPYMLASLYLKTKNYTQAIEVYRKLASTYRDNLLFSNNLASLLVDHGNNKTEDNKEALHIIQELKAIKDPVFLDTTGWVYYKNGEYKEAILYLKKAIEKSPDNFIFNYHLGMAFNMLGDIVQAKYHLEKSLSLSSGSLFEGAATARNTLESF